MLPCIHDAFKSHHSSPHHSDRQSRDLPPLAQAAAKTLQLLHPDWEYLFFDDTDVIKFIAMEFPQHRSVFDSFPYRIQRFDFFRYLAVLRFGGFYFDLDVFLFGRA